MTAHEYFSELFSMWFTVYELDLIGSALAAALEEGSQEVYHSSDFDYMQEKLLPRLAEFVRITDPDFDSRQAS